MKKHTFTTPIGPLIAIGDDSHLHLLAFSDQRHMKTALFRLEEKHANIPEGLTQSIQSIVKELNLYFDGALSVFKTPTHSTGTAFQEKSWKALKEIPYGCTRSYLEQAQTIGNRNAFRAVANANSKNPFTIIVPCHRVINHNGKLGGYAGGIDKKQWLLDHEKKHFKDVNA